MKVDKVLEVFKNLVLKAKSLSRAQAIATATAAVVAVGGVGTGGYFIYENGHQQQETIADVVLETEMGTEDVSSEETEDVIIADIVVVADETEAAEAEVEEKVLTLVGTSMEKDLKIKIQDQNSKLVTGAEFTVSVAQNKNGAKATNYEDKDKDGIIYIDDIKAGDYKVVLEEIEGYTIKTGTITVTVKDQLEYKRVDVTAEIKSEKEVNTAVEDTAINNVPVEAELTDTLPLLESTVTTTKVDRSQVSTSNFTAPSESGTKDNYAIVTRSEKKEPEGGNSGDTGTEEPGGDEPEEPGGDEPEEPGDGDEKPDGSDDEDKKPDGSDNETEKPDESEENSLNDTSQMSAASIERNSVSRVTAQDNADTVTTTATVYLPQKVTMYYGGNTKYTVKAQIDGDQSIIKDIEWSDSTDPQAFVVEKGSGNSATITYTGKGSTQADILATIFYDAGYGVIKSDYSLKFTVVATRMTDGTTPLKDQSGNTLYVDEKATKTATLKDYWDRTVFYTAPQYTGWQTLDGKVYYYDANHNAVTGNQVIGGVTYTFAADGSLSQSSGSRGIDVSKYQGSIDWGAVASSGISFAIIRVGYRGASTGALVEDPYFKSNIAGATRAGIKVGVYFFTQAISEAEAVEEASMVLSLISGYRVTYPVFIDTESATNGRANGLDTGTRTAVVRAFCQTVANGGYKAGVYASKNWFGNQLNASALSNYCIWVAQYNTSCTYSGKYDMWQYTSSGTVPGINGRVDMDISYMNY